MAKRVALIGKPLKRRHSEIMHNAAFEHFSIDASYELREIEKAGIRGFVAETRDEEWLGFQVTAPYKLDVVEFLDEIEEGAERIGAVNSVARQQDGRLVGFNTDSPGFRRGAESEFGISLAGISASVAGAGGAARAVVDALVSAGASRVTICDVVPERAGTLAARYAGSVQAVAVGAPFEDALRTAELAVNATTVGMIQQGTSFDVAVLPATCAVFDVVYNPPETELLRKARTRGLRATNGLGMLVSQAEIAFERWTGVTDAGPVMRRALNQALGPTD
ncbi:MAG: shikimate dehydrogenase [Acidimicrobiia bacterium]|nr:shikimate dehydrogenase [Acidimicrobiia bacterium]